MDVLETRLGETLRRTRLLIDAVAWLEAITPGLRAKTVKDWIQEDQLFNQGIDDNGNVIGHYSYVTELITRGKKQQGDHFTLYDTGDFYRSMFVRVLADSIVIEGDTGKMESQDWFTNDILGSTDENLAKFILEVKNGYIKYARHVLGLN